MPARRPMNSSPNRSPVIVGVGRSSTTPGELGAVQLALQAVESAWRDCGLAGHAPPVDVLGVLRQAADSVPGAPGAGFAQAVARGLSSVPRRVVYAEAGGHTSQALLARACHLVATGEASIAVLVGTDAACTSADADADTSCVEDPGPALAGVVTRWMGSHRMMSGRHVHALIADARRRRPDDLNRTARLLERLAESRDQQPSTSPRDAAGAVIVMSRAAAAELGLATKRFVYPHGAFEAEDFGWLQRTRLDDSSAVRLACAHACRSADPVVAPAASIHVASPFSTYAIVACDALGLTADHSRYVAMSASAPHDTPDPHDALLSAVSMVERLRAEPAGPTALLVAPGHALARCAAGIWSLLPPDAAAGPATPIARAAVAPPVMAMRHADGHGSVEACAVFDDEPPLAAVVGLLDANGQRFIALSDERDTDMLSDCRSGEAESVHVRGFGYGNRCAGDATKLEALYPARQRALRDGYRHCTVLRDGHLLEITIDRPDMRNCLNPEANEELDEIFDAYAADNSLWVAILTGSGTQAFCTGNDLKYAASGRPVYVPRNGFGGMTWRTDLDKPVIAAVNGFAMGGGMELAMACDLVVADASALFALTEVRVGLLAVGSALMKLPRQIPPKFATEMILTGRRVPAEEAHRLGLVNRLTPAGQALEGARALAAEILLGSPLSVRQSLSIMREAATFADQHQALQHPYDALDKSFWSFDRAEGVRAFAEKRTPAWRNR